MDTQPLQSERCATIVSTPTQHVSRITVGETFITLRADVVAPDTICYSFGFETSQGPAVEIGLHIDGCCILEAPPVKTVVDSPPCAQSATDTVTPFDPLFGGCGFQITFVPPLVAFECRTVCVRQPGAVGTTIGSYCVTALGLTFCCETLVFTCDDPPTPSTSTSTSTSTSSSTSTTSSSTTTPPPRGANWDGVGAEVAIE